MSGIELMAALNACPREVASNDSCLNTTGWWSNIPLSNKVTITKRRSTTVFDRYNYTILDVLNLSDEWNATSYTRDDFFPIFDAVFTVHIDNPGWNTSTQCDFLRRTYSYFIDRINATETRGADEGLAKLRSLFAVPVLVFNDAVYGANRPVLDDLGKSITLAKVSYRVQVSRALRLISDYYYIIFSLGICSLRRLYVCMVPCCLNDMLVYPDAQFITVP
jgi:hypothetical protein